MRLLTSRHVEIIFVSLNKLKFIFDSNDHELFPLFRRNNDNEFRYIASVFHRLLSSRSIIGDNIWRKWKQEIVTPSAVTGRRKSWKRLRVRSESTKKVLELRLIAEGGVCCRCKGNVKDEFEHWYLLYYKNFSNDFIKEETLCQSLHSLTRNRSFLDRWQMRFSRVRGW